MIQHFYGFYKKNKIKFSEKLIEETKFNFKNGSRYGVSLYCSLIMKKKIQKTK